MFFGKKKNLQLFLTSLIDGPVSYKHKGKVSDSNSVFLPAAAPGNNVALSLYLRERLRQLNLIPRSFFVCGLIRPSHPPGRKRLPCHLTYSLLCTSMREDMAALHSELFSLEDSIDFLLPFFFFLSM